MEQRRIWHFSGLRLAALILVTAAVFSFMLPGSFLMMDDQQTIIDNGLIRGWHNVPEIFGSSFFGNSSYYRPLVTISYLLDYSVSGPHPLVFKFTNLLWHLLCVVSVHALARAVTGRRDVSFYTALLFALHPVQWSAVSVVAGRSNLLSAFFLVNALNSFIIFMNDPRRKGWWILSLGLACLGLLCKESLVILPLLLVSYVLIFRRGSAPGIWGSVRWVVPFFILDGIYLLLRTSLGITNLARWNSLSAMSLGVITFLRSLITYLRMLIFPVDLHFDRSREFFTSFAQPGAVLTVIFWCAILFALIRFRKKMNNQILFWGSVFLVPFLPASQVVPIIVNLNSLNAAEHMLYVPSIGIFVLMVLGAQRLARKAADGNILSPVILRIAAAGLFLFFVLQTVTYCIHATSDIAMFERTLKYNPGNTRVRNALGGAYIRDHRLAEAEAQYRAALAQNPANARSRIGLAQLLFYKGEFFAALNEYEQITYAGDMAALLKQKWDMSLKFLTDKYSRLAEEFPADSRIQYTLGVVHSKAGLPRAAMRQYQKALDLDPRNQHAAFNLGVSYARFEEEEVAVKFFEKVLEMKGHNPELENQALMAIIQINAEENIPPGNN